MDIKLDTVYNCDCMELMEEMLREGVKVDCIITDPPYLINYKTNHRKSKNHKFCETIQNDDNPQLIIDLIRYCTKFLKIMPLFICFAVATK